MIQDCCGTPELTFGHEVIKVFDIYFILKNDHLIMSENTIAQNEPWALGPL